MSNDENPVEPDAAKPALSLRKLPGSNRGPAPQTTGAGQLVDAGEPVEVTLILRRKEEVADVATAGLLTRDELRDQYGASEADIELVTTTLTALGAKILSSDAASRRMRVAGTAGVLSTIFGTQLESVTSVDPNQKKITHRHRTGSLSVPAALDGIITAVLGLDDRPQAATHFHVAAAKSASTSYTPLQLGTIYGFPDGLDGTGQTIAIIELGGGFDQADLDTYFAGLGITGPAVTAVGVDGAVNVPGQDPQGADGEVLLDIEVAGALAPKASLKVYFAPNTDAGFVDAISQAAHDTPTPSAMSISWGQSEDQWTAQSRAAMDSALVDAVLLGVTVTVAAGDNGSADAESDGKNHADFPASSPHALACGGTSLHANVTTGAVTSETVWNDSTSSATGGGVSDTFPAPAWQANVMSRANKGSEIALTGRGIPDVAAVADPDTGYQVRVDGTDMVIGGTSAVAPLWAALLARYAQQAGHGLGLVQPVLYTNATSTAAVAGFRDIIKGTNGSYDATKGWDACSGLGVPEGAALLGILG